MKWKTEMGGNKPINGGDGEEAEKTPNQAFEQKIV